MKPYLSACFLLLSFSAHGGALHKWVDADGKVHYSDGPPPANGKALKVQPPSSRKDALVTKTVAEREAEYKKEKKAKQETEEKSAKQQEEILAKQKNCELAKQNLKTLENDTPLVSYDAKGERSFLDDTSRKQRKEEAQKVISTSCN